MDATFRAKETEAAVDDIYLPRPATLTAIQPVTPLDSLFDVALDGGEFLGPMPGQFVEVSLPGIGEAPISVCSSPTRGAGFQLLIRRIGNVTQALHRSKAGDKVGIRGPFGTTFPVDTELRQKNILFVGGGIGLAPLRSAIQYVLDRRWDYGKVVVLYGSRTPADRLFAEELEQWKRRDDLVFLETVDQGSPDWTGHVGLITTLFPMVHMNGDSWASVVCGPPAMYKFVIRELRKRQVPNHAIYVSLERRMKCGVGKCGHCQINGLYVCQEGPVFRYKDLFDLREAIA